MENLVLENIFMQYFENRLFSIVQREDNYSKRDKIKYSYSNKDMKGQKRQNKIFKWQQRYKELKETK